MISVRSRSTHKSIHNKSPPLEMSGFQQEQPDVSMGDSSTSPQDVVSALHLASLSGDRELIISTLEENAKHFSCIPLPPPAPCDASQAVKDILRERVVLNGISFLGQGSLFLETLRRLSEVLCSSDEVGSTCGDSTGNFVVDAILTRCARTTSGYDSYNTVLQLLQSPTMILKPRSGENPPIDIELFVTNGGVHGAVSSTNMYGFYRLEDIEQMGNRTSDHSMSGDDQSDNPWLSIDTVIVEKIDFRTGRSLRFLRIEIPNRVSESTAGGEKSSIYSRP